MNLATRLLGWAALVGVLLAGYVLLLGFALFTR